MMQFCRRLGIVEKALNLLPTSLKVRYTSHAQKEAKADQIFEILPYEIKFRKWEVVELHTDDRHVPYKVNLRREIKPGLDITLCLDLNSRTVITVWTNPTGVYFSSKRKFVG